jgi:ATP-dependent DNA ligase
VAAQIKHDGFRVIARKEGARVKLYSHATPKPPVGGLWLHEIKHDGFRVIARKDRAQQQ